MRMCREAESSETCRKRSFRHLKAFRTCETLQCASAVRVAGEEEDLVVFREGSEGLDGGSAAGAVHVGEAPAVFRVAHPASLRYAGASSDRRGTVAGRMKEV